MKKNIMVISTLLVMSSCSCNIYDYVIDWEGWKKVVIPTESMKKASINIPIEWEFEKDKQSISLINKSNNEIIATQLCQALFTTEQNDNGEWYLEFYEGIYTENDEFDIKNDKLSFDKRVYSGYDSSAVYDFNINDKCVFGFAIYYLYYFADEERDVDMRNVDFGLFMILNNATYYETLVKAFYSYEFAGIIYI